MGEGKGEKRGSRAKKLLVDNCLYKQTQRNHRQQKGSQPLFPTKKKKQLMKRENKKEKTANFLKRNNHPLLLLQQHLRQATNTHPPYPPTTFFPSHPLPYHPKKNPNSPSRKKKKKRNKRKKAKNKSVKGKHNCFPKRNPGERKKERKKEREERVSSGNDSAKQTKKKPTGHLSLFLVLGKWSNFTLLTSSFFSVVCLYENPHNNVDAFPRRSLRCSRTPSFQCRVWCDLSHKLGVLESLKEQLGKAFFWPWFVWFFI